MARLKAGWQFLKAVVCLAGVWVCGVVLSGETLDPGTMANPDIYNLDPYDY